MTLMHIFSRKRVFRRNRSRRTAQYIKKGPETMRPSICVGIIMHRKELLRRCFPGCAGNRKPPAPSCTKKRFWTSCRPEKRNISPESPYFLRIHRRSRSLAARQQSSRLHMYRKNPEILHSLTADSSSPGFYFPLSKTSATFFRYSVTESFWGQWRSQLLHPMHSAALPCFRASRS